MVECNMSSSCPKYEPISEPLRQLLRVLPTYITACRSINGSAQFLMFSDENFLFLGVSHPKNAADAKLMLKKDEEIHKLNSDVQSLVRVIARQLPFIPSTAFFCNIWHHPMFCCSSLP